jgi:hypothetical protein
MLEEPVASSTVIDKYHDNKRQAENHNAKNHALGIH